MIQNIDEIKANISIYDIVSHYIPLKKSGGNFVTNCPFHDENSPSFFVNTRKNIFHCFGCEAGGNGIDFIMKYEGVPFHEAAKLAATICNISVHESTSFEAKQAHIKKLDLQERLQKLEQRQEKELLKHEKIVAYLQKRGIEKEHLSEFHIGFCLEKHEIMQILGNYALDLGFITASGYNFFQNRILFTIRNKSNNIVGFSGRTHPYTNFKNQAKYLNPKESFLYKKKEVFYNLEHAKKLLIRNKFSYIFIVEGYMDALTCNLLHIPSVAICGTAFNKSHLAQLQNIIKDSTQIYIALDNDKAGEIASIRAFKECMKNGFIEAHIARLKGEYKDINEAYTAGVRKKPFTAHKGLEFALQKEIKEAGSLKEAQENLKYYVNYYENCKDTILKEYIFTHLRPYIYAPLQTEKKEASPDEFFLFSCMAQNEDCAYIAASYIDSSYFYNAQVFTDLIHKRDTAQTRFYAMQEIPKISPDEFYRILLRYRVFMLENAYKKAMQKPSIDYSYLHTLSDSIKQLKTNLKSL